MQAGGGRGTVVQGWGWMEVGSRQGGPQTLQDLLGSALPPLAAACLPGTHFLLSLKKSSRIWELQRGELSHLLMLSHSYVRLLMHAFGAIF